MKTLFFVLLTLMIPATAMAQDAGVSEEIQYIFNTLLFLIGGFLVMFMAAGFCMLESGLVRSTSVSTICVKNICLYSIAGLMFYFCGYQLMYSGVDGGFIGELNFWVSDESGALAEDGSFIGEGGGYSSSSDWFFQMVFVATTASIVSGTIAERSKLWSFLIFSAILAGFIYPIAGSWHWGGGWLAEIGFADFAGSTLVHSVGGWAALVAAIVIGPRKGRFDAQGKSHPMPGSSVPLATLGTFILWFGWFGFNGASQLAMGTGADIDAVAKIFVNTNMAAAAGTLIAALYTQMVYGKVDPSITLNGALAGLVSITAEPLTPSPAEAILIGGAGALIMALVIPALDKLKIDDVVGAIPVHLCCGIWGTLAVPLTNADASFGIQVYGIAAYAGFTLFCSLLAWLLLKVMIGVRINEEHEDMGIDRAECGLDAYPEFVRNH